MHSHVPGLLEFSSLICCTQGAVASRSYSQKANTGLTEVNGKTFTFFFLPLKEFGSRPRAAQVD